LNNEHYYYSCSREYINRISPNLYDEVTSAIINMPKHQTQSEINRYLFERLTELSWAYDSIPPGTDHKPITNERSLCITSSTLQANWHSDFAKEYDSGIVQVEVQFGKVKSMFKDFCGFRIAYAER